MIWTRRRFLALGALGALTLAGGYAYVRGVRYPPLRFTPGVAPVSVTHNGAQVSAQGAVFQSLGDDSMPRFRAFTPEPRLRIRVPEGRPWQVQLHNVHREASLSTGNAAGVSEQRHGLARIVSGQVGGELELSWRFPQRERYRFAIIGDSGGGKELQWVLRRSAELQADFLLHTGDLHYQPGDLASAAKVFESTTIPSYVAIGNHDFHDGLQAIYDRFVHYIGPRNSTFRLAGVQFVNFDTATNFWPAKRGARYRLIQRLPALGKELVLMFFRILSF